MTGPTAPLSLRVKRLVERHLPSILTDLIRAGLRRAGVPETDQPAPAPAPVQAQVATAAVTAPPPPPRRIYWGLHDLDRQIERHLDFDGGYFVELGANNGVLASNTLYYERERGWRGVLVEPAPNLFLECLKNRSRETHIACAACVSFDYKPEFVKLIYSDSMSVSLDLESDIADPASHAELGRQFLRQDETVFAFGALARPLNAILIEAGAPATIDFLSLDVEGAELEVLKGIDHSAFRFRFILAECRDISRLECYLAPLGYALVERFNYHDYLFTPVAARDD